MTSKLFLILILVVVLFSSGWVAGNRVAASGWDYKTVLSDTGSDKELNVAGAEGWELVTIVRLENSSSVYLYFKRHK
jgi:hypothetical protein